MTKTFSQIHSKAPAYLIKACFGLMAAFGLTAFSGLSLPVQAQYGGVIINPSSTASIQGLPGRYQNGLKLNDPYDCGGSKIYGFVEGGNKPYSVTLSLLSSNRSLNKTVIFEADGQNWRSEVSYDSSSPNFVPKDTYTVTSTVRDSSGNSASYSFSALIQPLPDCSTSSSSSSTNNNTNANNSSNSTNNSTGTVITNGTNQTPKTGEVIKVVQTQLLRTGGFVQSNPVVFSSSILLLALGTTLYLNQKPKTILR